MRIIGICGGTGSGKTTLARHLADHIGGENVVLIEQDSYYLNLSDLPLDTRQHANFDHPESVDFASLAAHLAGIKRGETIEIPVYEFATHTRSDKTRTVEPKPVIIVEGILIFSQPEIVDLLDVKVFVDTPTDIRLLRRIRRDIDERGRTLEQTMAQYEKTIRHMHRKYVEPSKRFADVILPDGGMNQIAFELLSVMIQKDVSAEKHMASS